MKNYRMHLQVEYVEDWHSHVVATAVAQRFNFAVGQPVDQPWAMRDFTLFDPGGVLWRIAHNVARR